MSDDQRQPHVSWWQHQCRAAVLAARTHAVGSGKGQARALGAAAHEDIRCCSETMARQEQQHGDAGGGQAMEQAPLQVRLMQAMPGTRSYIAARSADDGTRPGRSPALSIAAAAAAPPPASSSPASPQGSEGQGERRHSGATQAAAPRWMHFVSGGVGGCISATVTCPLEVVKTRMQSSLYTYEQAAASSTSGAPSASAGAAAAKEAPGVRSAARRGLYAFSQTAYALRDTAAREGVSGLWRGLGPMLLGVVPARSIYFLAYSQLKPHFGSISGNTYGDWVTHLSASACAALCSTTLVSPIWVVKTQVQLLSFKQPAGAGHTSGSSASHGARTAATATSANATTATATQTVAKGAAGSARASLSNTRAVARNIWQTDGLRGFFRGWTASAAGVIETAIQFTIYEHLKARLVNEDSAYHGLQTFGVSALAKFCAISLTYPHEVLRTRLRQEMHKGPRRYRGFFQTLALVYREEGARALYAGMPAHMMRSVPNAAILILSYEVALRLYHRYAESSQ